MTMTVKEYRALLRRDTHGYIEDMVRDFLNNWLDDNKKNQIRKCLNINGNLTSTYALQVKEVWDCLGKDSKTSGWYIILEGTRCGVKFYINNDYEIIRKPRNVEVKHIYDLYNCSLSSESFWAYELDWNK